MYIRVCVCTLHIDGRRICYTPLQTTTHTHTKTPNKCWTAFNLNGNHHCHHFRGVKRKTKYFHFWHLELSAYTIWLILCHANTEIFECNQLNSTQPTDPETGEQIKCKHSNLDFIQMSNEILFRCDPALAVHQAKEQQQQNRCTYNT